MLSKFVLVDTDVVQKVKQGSPEEKTVLNEILRAGHLAFYSKRTVEKCSGFGGALGSGYTYTVELARFHFIDKEPDRLGSLRVLDSEEHQRRLNLVNNVLGLAFKKRYPPAPFTETADYATSLKEDRTHHNHKDFSILTPLISYKFDCFITGDGGIFQICQENSKAFNALNCIPLHLHSSGLEDITKELLAD